MENTISKIAKVKSKKSKAGVFITLPDDIAKQFPLLGAHDDSDPHITVLFIGVVPKKHEDLLAETVKKVAKECEPFVMKLDDKVTYFPPTKHSDGCKIAKMKIISEGLHELHKALKKAITDAGIEIDDHFSSYKPHTTLAYMQPPRKTYDREVPSGSWLAEEIHIWNGDDKKKIRLGNNKKANDMISVRAGVKSDKPAYKEKIKTDKGYVWKYDEKHIEKRWKVKKDKIKKLEKDIRKVREQYKKDLNSDDDRTRAIAAIVGIMDDTAMRIGNEESAKDGTFGASTLKVKHVKNNKGKITFDFPGKGAIEQNVILKNKEVIKTINDLMKGKKANDFIFEVDGKKIWDRAVNRYLDQFGISAKDLRGFHSNRLMKEMLKKKDWKNALKEVSEIVGHEATTLKNQYIDPDIVEKYENKQKKDKKSERIMILKAYDDQIEQSDIGGPELSSTQLEQYMPQNLESGNQPNQPVNIYKNIGNIKSKVVDQKEQIKISPLIATAWNIIAPFMPSTVYLSSGFRSMRDQVNTIINYWNDKWGGYFAKNFPDRGKTVADMHKIINEYDPSIPGTPPGGPTREEATIAFPGKSLHQSGNALDISGVSANDITKIIEWINRHLGTYVSFNVLNEGDHVHVSIKKAIYPGPQNMMSVLREFYYGIKAPEITKTQKHQVYLSKRALNPQDETFVNRLEQKYFGANKPQISTKSKLTQLGIKSNVRLNETILAAWVLLKPYLPQNAVMTSGARTSQDQIRIINNYWTKSKLNEKYPNIIDPYDRSKLLIQNGWIVGPPTAKGKNIHLSGRAFDVSGSNLDEIASAARAVSNNPNIPVTFSQILIERKNNNVHIGIGNVSQLSKLIGKTASQSAISKIGAEENMKNQVQSIYEDLMKSNPPKDVADEFVRAFGLEINKNAKVKDDEDGKYEREKSDPKWKQILIDSDRKWTRKEIRDHYIKNADKIMREIKGKPIMIYVNTGKTNQNVLKRKHNEKPIVFNNTNDLKRWADRRLLSIHRVLGPKTTLGFVDLDVHDNFSDSKVKEYARKIAAKIKSKYGSTPIIYDSGGTGYHVEFKVKEMSTDTLRHELRELCEDLNEEFDGFTTGIVKGTGVRTDTTTLKNNGNLRVPWALHEKYGGVKKPIGKTAALSIRQKTAINVEDIGFGVEDEPGDYFEKSRMFLHRQPLEYDKHNAHKLAENDPAKFFYLGLHKSNPSLEAKALENMIKDNPKFYFIFNFDKREEPEFKRLKQKASEELAQQDPRSFFYYNLHHEMPELGRGAILHLIDKDPRSFGQLGLEKDYPDYAESATHAINIYDPTKTEVIDSKASVKLSKRATNEKVDVLYVVHPDAIIEQSTNVDYVNSYLSKVKQAISSHVGPVIVTSLGRKFGSNTEAGDIAKLFMKEISGDSDINVIYETGAERSMFGLKAGEKMLDDLYLNNALGTIKVGGCFTGSWCKMCVDDTIKQLTKQYGPDHVVFDNSITAAAGIVPKGKLFEPSEAPQENKQASVKLSKRDDNVYSFTEATDELIEKIENLPGYRFGGPVGFFGQLTFNASVEVQWMLGTHKPAGSLEGYTVEVVIIHSDSDKEHIKDSFSTYEKAYNYLSDTLRDVVSYYQRLEEEKGAEIIPFPKMSSLISKRAEYGPDYGWKKWVQNYSNIPGQKNEKLSSRTLMLKKAFGPTVIAPMRLKKIKDPSELLDKYKKEELSIQHKFDGWKTQAIKDSKGAVKLYTRKGSGFEANVPELVKELEKKLDSGDFVLGELTFEKNGVQSISDVQTIAGSSPEKAQEHLKKTKGHLVFQAYDLLWNNGHDITKESYIERYNKLKKQIGESSIIKVPKNYSWDEFDIAMRNAQKEGSEGVVIKTKDSKYNYGPKGANEKTGDWYKYKIKGKKAQTDEVILNKYEHGKEKLKFPAYQYKDGKLFEVGVLSGLPKDKEKEIKNKIDNGKSVVVEVTYQEIMPSGKFRHMGWGGRERPDKPLKEVKVNK